MTSSDTLAPLWSCRVPDSCQGPALATTAVGIFWCHQVSWTVISTTEDKWGHSTHTHPNSSYCFAIAGHLARESRHPNISWGECLLGICEAGTWNSPHMVELWTEFPLGNTDLLTSFWPQELSPVLFWPMYPEFLPVLWLSWTGCKDQGMTWDTVSAQML